MTTIKKNVTAKVGRPSHASGERKGIQSVEVGVRVIDALAAGTEALPLGEVGRMAGISASQAHRYLTSFSKSGLVYQDSGTGRYGLGPQALRWGISAMTKTDAVEVSALALDEISARLDLTGLLCIWGDRGPTCVRLRRSKLLLGTDLGLGSVFPVLASATGHAFLAYLPRAMTKDFVERELADPSRHNPYADPAAQEAMCADVRKNGIAQELNHFVDQVSAIAAPIFNHQSDVVAVITLVFRGALDKSDTRHSVASELKRVTAEVSRSLGFNSKQNPLPSE